MPYSYITVDALKGTAWLSATGTNLDTRIRHMAEGVSGQIDGYVKGNFQPLALTRTFGGNGGTRLIIPAIISVTSLKEDNNDDGTFDTTWSATDFLLAPFNADPTNDWGRPYTQILVSNKSNGTQDIFLHGQQNYQIAGTWGYRSITVDTGRNTSVEIDSTVSFFDVDGTVQDVFGIGMTIQIETEQMYVVGVGSGAGTRITVTRGVNGSTAATHTTTSDINAFEYPEAVREAGMIQVMTEWTQKNAGFGSEQGFPDVGFRPVLSRGLHPEVKALLNPFRRFTV